MLRWSWEPRSILVVDDEPMVRQTLQAMLTTLGHRVETASDGAEALRKLTPETDLLLLDVDLPGMNGFEVTRRLRLDQSWSHLPIIIVTANDSKPDRLRAAEVGATDFIGKPVELTELSVRTTSVLRMKEAQDAVRRYQAELEQMVAERTAALVQARDEALAASRAKSAFLTRMSHEFRTPLNHIIGFSEMLLEEAAELQGDGWSSELQIIQRSGERLLELTMDVLEFADAESGKSSVNVESFTLAALLSNVTVRAQPLADTSGNRLDVQPASGPVILETDRKKLESVIMQLVKNACAFTHGGIVSIQAEPQRIGDAEWVQLLITDTGPGMTPAQLELAFQPFWQADTSDTRQHGGAGLGLALARHYCQLLGGDLTAASEPGSGSELKLFLPARLIR